MSRGFVITRPGKYNKKIYADILLPIVKKYEGSKSKCVTETFTESEHRFSNLVKAKNAAKEIKAVLSESKFIFDKNSILHPTASVMPINYEKTGARNIVRPDYSLDLKKVKINFIM